MRIGLLAFAFLFSGCSCDEVLGRLPAPAGVLVKGADESPPLPILEVGLDPTPLSQTATVDIGLRNDGNADLLVQSVVFGSDPEKCPAPSGAFTIIDPLAAFALKAAATHTLQFGFTPTSGAPACTVVEVHSNDASHPVLRAVITGQGDAPQLCTDRAIVDFGEVFVGQTKSDVVHLESCGTRPITITGASLNPQFPDPFTAGATATGAPLAPGAFVDIPVDFHPLVEQSWSLANGTSGTITLTTDAPQASEYRVDLVGVGTRPPSCEIQVVPSVVQFGNIGEGRSSTQTVFIRNIGQLDCTFTSADVRAPAGSFSSVLVDLASGDVLGPQQSGSVSVTFAPAVANGTENGNLDVVTDDPVNPTIAVPLEGTSVTVTPCFLEASPTALNFGNQPLLHSAERTITLTNVGADNCIIKRAELAAGAPDFHVLPPAFPLTPVFSGASVEVVASFRPTTPGSKAGTARVTYKLFGLGNPDQTLDVPLSGQAVAPCITVTPLDVDYGTVASGATADRDVQVRNCGGVDLVIRGVDLRSGTHPGFHIQTMPTPPSVLAAGAQETVTVRAAPTGSGPMFGQLEVLSDVAPQIVSLHANAPAACNQGLVCQPDNIAFGEVEVGQSLVKSFVCMNPSSSSVLVIPAVGGPFTIVSAPASIPAGGQGVVRVRFSPTSPGDANATLNLGGNSCAGGPVTAPVSGTGVQNDLPPCPTPTAFSPQLVWNWDGGGVLPNSKQVWGTPLVSRLEDTDGDGHLTRLDMPRVIFTSFDKADAPNYLAVGPPGSQDQINDPVPGVLRAVDGATGAEVWTANQSPEHRLNTAVTPALVDLDGDGCVDIIGEKYVLLPGVEVIPNGPKIDGKFARGNLIAFDCHGTFKWVSDEWTRNPHELEDDGGLAVGDVDGDGFAEIAVADHLFDHNGHLLWVGGRGTGSAGHGPVSVLADVDGQPGLELVSGATVYRADGSILWDHLADVDFDGLPAVADLDGNGTNEVVFRGSELRVFEGATGQEIAGPRYPPTRSDMPGPDCESSYTDPDGSQNACNIIPNNPAIMDVNGDGRLDIAVPSQQIMLCYDSSLNEMWRANIFDGTGASGAVGFDFEADGTENIVYADETTIWSWTQAGQTIYQAPRQSVTMYEYASVADIDLDGHANILVGSNEPMLGTGHGLKAYENTGVSWAQARGMWNQHPYLESLISELGTPIPNTAGAMPYRGFRTATPQCVP